MNATTLNNTGTNRMKAVKLMALAVMALAGMCNVSGGQAFAQSDQEDPPLLVTVHSRHTKLQERPKEVHPSSHSRPDFANQVKSIDKQPNGNRKLVVKDKVTRFNQHSSVLKKMNGYYYLMDGDRAVTHFGTDTRTAYRALGVIKFYRTNMIGTVGHPRPSMTYLLANGSTPVGAMPNEESFRFDPRLLAVKQVGPKWKVMAGEIVVLECNTRAEALKSFMVIKKHGFTHKCFIGLPNPVLVYFRK